MVSIAIDFGGSSIKLAVVKNGEILNREVVATKKGKGIRAHLSLIENAIKKLMSRIDVPIEGIGIAFAGLVDSNNKRVISVNKKYEDALEFDFKEWINSRFGLPVILENDANAALLGEVSYGSARGYKDAVILILGTGVGTAAIMEEKLIRGKHFQAGCLCGHFAIPGNERDCSCGKKGCLEASASGWALPIIYKERNSEISDSEIIDFKFLEKAVLSEDEIATDILTEFTDVWSATAKNLVHAYDPEVVVLSGGVIKCGDMVIEPIIKKTKESVWTAWGEIEFVVSENPEDSVLLGLHSILEKGECINVI